MIEKTKLLHELKIDREGDVPVAPKRRRVQLAGSLGLIVLGVGSVYLMAQHQRDIRFAAGDAVRPVAEKVASPAPATAAVPVLDASGYIVARRQATLSAKITGRLVEMYAEVGQHVKQGQIVARLDASNIEAVLLQAKAAESQAEAAVQQATTALADSEPSYRRDQKLAEAGMISKDALSISQGNYNARVNAVLVAKANVKVQQAAIEVARRNLDDTVVHAPFAGLLTSKNAQPGEIISPLSAGGGFTRTGIGTLVDMDSMEAEVDVNESFIGRVKQGAAASLRLNAYPDWTIPAYVVTVVPMADRAKGTVKVRVGFHVRDPRILPEMGVRVSFSDNAAATSSTHQGRD